MPEDIINEGSNLFKKLDQIIKENGGYLLNDHDSKVDISVKEADFREAINSFNVIAHRSDPSSPLMRSEYLAAEYYRKGMNTLFADNPNLASSEIAEKIINICKEEISKMSKGHGKLLLLDTISDIIKESSIVLMEPLEDIEFSKQDSHAPVYRYIEPDLDEIPGSGLSDIQINNILKPIIELAKEKDLAIRIGNEQAKKFRKQVNNLYKGLSGYNTLKDDHLICDRLDILTKFLNQIVCSNINNVNNILEKIQASIVEAKKFMNRFPEVEQKKSLQKKLSYLQDAIEILTIQEPETFYSKSEDIIEIDDANQKMQIATEKRNKLFKEQKILEKNRRRQKKIQEAADADKRQDLGMQQVSEIQKGHDTQE